MLVLREAQEGGVPGHIRASAPYDKRLQRIPNPGLPVDQSAVAVEGQDPVAGQSSHCFEFP